MDDYVYFVYYTSYYYYVDSVWTTREDAEKRLAEKLQVNENWNIQVVMPNVPGGAIY